MPEFSGCAMIRSKNLLLSIFSFDRVDIENLLRGYRGSIEFNGAFQRENNTGGKTDHALPFVILIQI